MNWVERLGRFTAFASRCVAASPAALAAPKDWLPHAHAAFFGLLPLVLAAGSAMGVVAWLQLRDLLSRFGAVEMLPGSLALTVVWEFGPVGLGLMAAGRLGSGFGAELSALAVTEQLDAAQALGIPLIRRIVAPRVLAAILVLPLLTVIINFTAVFAAGLAEFFGGTLTPERFAGETLRFLALKDVIPATLKTMVFGGVVGLAGSWQGLTARGDAVGVGRAATRAVMFGMLGVLLADVVLVRLIQVVVG